MRLVIAEKPSVAMALASVIGARSRRDGFMEGNGYLVSWCVGHLVGLCDAADYDERYRKGAVFTDIEELVAEKTFGLKSTNLLDKQNDVIDKEVGFSFYCLTSEEKRYGASMILQEDVMGKVSKLMGGDFYILPSSIHETLIVPTTTQMTLEDMSIMVQYVNKEAVEPEDKLSDKVQFYDSKEMVIENAKKRESRLAMEKASTKEAGIHKKLQENRQKNMKVPSEGKRTSNRDLAAL